MSMGFTKDYVVKATGETALWKHLTPQFGATDEDLDFTIPSGVNVFKLVIEDVDTSTSADNILIQLGDSGGLHTSGYYGGSHNFDSSTVAGNNGASSFVLNRVVSTEAFSGVIEFVRFAPGSHKWMMHGILGSSVANDEIITSGMVELDTELTTVSCQTTSTNTWQQAAGFNILYENPDLAISGNGSVAAGVTDVFINGTKQASTSGTEIDFTLPSGVTEFKVTYVGVSAGTDNMQFQLGDSGGVHATGYLGSGFRGNASPAGTNATTCFHLRGDGTSGIVHGTMTFTLHDASTNTWVCSGAMARSDKVDLQIAAGSVSLDTEVTTLRCNNASGQAFDAGSINIQYDNQELDLGSGVIDGQVLQTVHTTDSAVATSTTAIPINDTIPQSSEGSEVMTASITPNNTANKLRIDVVCNIAHSLAGAVVSAGLFQDSTANALAAGRVNTADNNARGQIVFTHWMDAGTEASTTFKVRVGGSTASTTTFNGTVGAREFGGVMASSITITEYKA